MAVLRLIFNIAWFVLGGFVMGLAWWLAGILCFISIIGIPLAAPAFVIGEMTFWPLWSRTNQPSSLTGRDDLGTGALGMVGKYYLVLAVWDLVSHRSTWSMP